MMTYEVEWISSNSVQETHRHLTIRQVYVWVLSSNGELVIVSKDGNSWQFPGGKPESGETWLETASREVYEETGIDISKTNAPLEFFGYRIVKEIEGGNVQPEYLQLRYLVGTRLSNQELTTAFENHMQQETEMIRYAKFASVPEVMRLLPWLAKSEEYDAFQKFIGTRTRY